VFNPCNTRSDKDTLYIDNTRSDKDTLYIDNTRSDKDTLYIDNTRRDKAILYIDNTRQKDKQWSAKHYTENLRLSNANLYKTGVFNPCFSCAPEKVSSTSDIKNAKGVLITTGIIYVKGVLITTGIIYEW
jgi:hypothetical protein